MKKIRIFTTLREDPMHYRLESILGVLNEAFDVEVFSYSSHTRLRKLNNVTLNFFYLDLVLKSIWKLRGAEIIYIQTLYLLPLAFFAKLLKKKVIYETLDNHAHLKFYDLSKRYRLMQKLGFIRSLIIFAERFHCKLFVDHVFVNSKALRQYFKNRAHLLYYCSPFEKKVFNKPNNKVAFLYLGALTDEKGKAEMLDLMHKYKLPLFFAGKMDSDTKQLVKKYDSFKYLGFLSSRDLENTIKELINEYFLLGLSIIKPIHYSYKTQEANKDIDFLSMGIPIIGNTRLPTKEKIDQGCGVFYSNSKEILKLINSKKHQSIFILRCREYYNQYYRQVIYREKLLNIFGN